MSDFLPEQKRYLEGFASGVAAARVAGGIGGPSAPAAPPEPAGPDAIHVKAQDRAVAAGGKLAGPGEMEARGAPLRSARAISGRGSQGTDPEARG